MVGIGVFFKQLKETLVFQLDGLLIPTLWMNVMTRGNKPSKISLFRGLQPLTSIFPSPNLALPFFGPTESLIDSSLTFQGNFLPIHPVFVLSFYLASFAPFYTAYS